MLGAVTVTDTDEFGIPNPTTPTAATARYGWLGAKERSAQALGGTILMGVRLYHPGTGRFLQVDPVPGGNATAYDYCSGDPINCVDLDGRWGWGDLIGAVAQVAEIASWIPGPIGSIAAGVSAVAYAATGNWSKAGEMALVGAANLVGGGAILRAGIGIVRAASRIAPRAISWAARAGRAVGSYGGNLAKRTAAYFRNGINILRIGRPKSNSLFRVSVGPAYNHYKKLPRWKRMLSPVHIHMDRKYGGVNFNWFTKPVKMAPRR